MSMYESNRSRSDSGTSGSSESSRGSGKPPRRRSHRPRGCRGGSSRRRINSLENANGKKPVKSGNDPSTTNNTNNTNNNNTTNNNKVPIDNKNKKSRPEQQPQPFSKNDVNPSRQQKNYSIPVQEFSFPSPQPKAPGLSRSYNNKDCRFQHGEQDSISLSAATAPSTDYSSNAGSSYDQSSPFYYQSHESIEFPAILRSFSDSSSEAAMEQHQHHQHHQHQQLPKYNSNMPPPCPRNTNTNTSRPNNDNGYILPPLPTNAFENDPIPSGPNPYALKLSTHPEGYYSQHPAGAAQQQPPLSSLSSRQQQQQDYGYIRPTMPNLQFQQQAPSLQMPYSNHHNQQQQQQHPSAASYDYHTERLEKQRQNVEGGSLFVTSPRSFLMGRKTEA
jgi:hypothetical protein